MVWNLFKKELSEMDLIKERLQNSVWKIGYECIDGNIVNVEEEIERDTKRLMYLILGENDVEIEKRKFQIKNLTKEEAEELYGILDKHFFLVKIGKNENGYCLSGDCLWTR